ncbi:MAG: diphthine--ammonia ligase [Natrialbaceae archaeon]|nr:diphthine--ammonia ligase [Natrialbaceae archaeon]
MADGSGAWLSLFSGGKDSAWALYAALEQGRTVERLVTVHPPADSYLYHVPATELVSHASQSIGIPVSTIDADRFPALTTDDSTQRGAMELEPLESRLGEIADSMDRKLGGLVAGAVASEYQADLLEGICDRLGCDLDTPLWQADPRSAATAMLDAGFEIVIVAVAAAGLDQSWLGRRIDERALEELEALGDSHGVHLLGEGGEFETLVVDGPHMNQRIDIEFEREWDGTRGELRITDAALGSR